MYHATKPSPFQMKEHIFNKVLNPYKEVFEVILKE